MGDPFTKESELPGRELRCNERGLGQCRPPLVRGKG